MITDIFGNEIVGDLEVGRRYREFNGCGGYVEFTHCEIDNTPAEADWVLSELRRTDDLVKLPDYPHIDILIEYRAELRKYDKSGARPMVPKTPSGTLI